jgi:branched-chain amino acid transport system permease protein
VVRPQLLGLDLTTPTAYFTFASVVFALLLLVAVAVRRSTFGERLIAMKEGPAALATCGVNVRAQKLAVFALSAAIAGIGGAVLSGSEPANSGTFDFVAGLPVLMVMVIAGITSVAAPIAVGVFLGSPLVFSIFPGFERWQNILVGFAGVGLGQNPNGFIADLRRPSSLVKSDPPVLVGMIGGLVVVWALRLAELYSNGPYVVLTLVVPAIAVVVAGRRRARHAPAPSEDPGRPPELLGLTTPFTEADLAALDEALGLDTVEVGSRARG